MARFPTTRVAPWRLDLRSRELVWPDRRQRLAEKPFHVLAALIEAEGGVVTRDALQRRLWSEDTFVDFDNNLNSAVTTLRQALGDSARSPTDIETLPKVGYRLLRVPTSDARGTTAPRRRAAVGLTAAALVIGALAVSPGPRPPVTPLAPQVAPISPAARRAYERGIYLRGRYVSRHDDPAALDGALAAFREAARLDPLASGPAAEAAETLVEMSFAGRRGFADGLGEARAEARRAHARDPGDAVAFRVLAMTAMWLDWDFRSARRHLERAPADQARTALAWATWHAAIGELTDAVAAAERAVALDPAGYYVRADLAMFYLAAGRDADAYQSARDVLTAAPDFAPALTYAVMALERLGRWDDAKPFARQLMAGGGASAVEESRMAGLDGRQAVQAWRRWELARVEARAATERDDYALALALRHAPLGQHDRAIAGLERALNRHVPMLAFVGVFPELRGLKGHPRYEAVVRAVIGGGAPDWSF